MDSTTPVATETESSTMLPSRERRRSRTLSKSLIAAPKTVKPTPATTPLALVASYPECGGEETAACGFLRCTDCGSTRSAHVVLPLAVAPPSQRAVAEATVSQALEHVHPGGRLPDDMLGSLCRCGGSEEQICGNRYQRCRRCGNIRASLRIPNVAELTPNQRFILDELMDAFLAESPDLPAGASRQDVIDRMVADAFEPDNRNGCRLDRETHEAAIAAEHPLGEPLGSAFAPPPASDDAVAQWLDETGDPDARGEWATAIWQGLIILAILFALGALGFAAETLHAIHGGSH